MVFDADAAQIPVTPEPGERLRPVDEREPWTLPDRGITGPSMRGGFCPCARCQNVRRRIDGRA